MRNELGPRFGARCLSHINKQTRGLGFVSRNLSVTYLGTLTLPFPKSIASHCRTSSSEALITGHQGAPEIKELGESTLHL